MKKSMATASFLLGNDSRRISVTSVLMEGTKARLIRNSRSHSVVTEAFDVDECYEEAIRFMLFTQYASEEELGFDPKVTRVADADGNLQYQFHLKHTDEDIERTYQTVSVRKAATVTTRLHCSTKAVYLVRPAMKDDGLSVVEDALDRILYDGHQPGNRPDEHVILEKMRKQMKGHARSDEERRMIDDAIVTVLANEAIDREATYRSPSAGEDLLFVPYVRQRTVFGEFGEDLSDVKDPALFYFALGQFCKVLRQMRRAGHIHRDISPGYFYVFARMRWHERLNGQKLVDLYMCKLGGFARTKAYKSLSIDSDADNTSGPYTAIEVQAARHLFYRDDAPVALLARHHFAPNCFHDLESVLWIALEFALQRVSRDVLNNVPWEELVSIVRWQRDYLQLLFRPENFGSATRQKLMFGNEHECKLVRNGLERAYGVSSPVPQLVDLIYALGKAYMMVEEQYIDTDLEANPQADQVPYKKLPLHAFTAQIYEEMEKTFQQISDSSAGAEDELVALDDLPLDLPVHDEIEDLLSGVDARLLVLAQEQEAAQENAVHARGVRKEGLYGPMADRRFPSQWCYEDDTPPTSPEEFIAEPKAIVAEREATATEPTTPRAAVRRVRFLLPEEEGEVWPGSPDEEPPLDTVSGWRRQGHGGPMGNCRHVKHWSLTSGLQEDDAPTSSPKQLAEKANAGTSRMRSELPDGEKENVRPQSVTTVVKEPQDAAPRTLKQGLDIPADDRRSLEEWCSEDTDEDAGPAAPSAPGPVLVAASQEPTKAAQVGAPRTPKKAGLYGNQRRIPSRLNNDAVRRKDY